jgi:phosphoglycerate dehydrogenase-like enzyme
MKPNAVLVNVGRGATLDEPALVAALQAGRIRGAGLDVFTVEPLPATSPLWGMDNVLLSPHTADRTARWLDEAMDQFLENLRRFQDGRPLLNVVADKRRGY